MGDSEKKMTGVGRQFSADKMYVFLKGALTGAGMTEAVRALAYMRKHHEGQYRDDGQPYAVHPLMMACYAMSLESEFIDDVVMAGTLLHDVCEETNTPVDELPFSAEVRRAVKYVTLTRFKDETKFEHKKRYMNELLECQASVIIKAIDKMFNLMTMSAVFPDDKVRKNVVEVDVLFLPVLREAKQKWPEMSRLLWVLRTGVRGLNDTLALQLGVMLTDEEFVNLPTAVDYSYLLTGVQTPTSMST